jgi:large subunit ribosomal protein L20
MARVKRGVTAHAKHKKTLKAAKGFRGRRKNTIRTAKAAVDRSMQYEIGRASCRERVS